MKRRSDEIANEPSKILRRQGLRLIISTPSSNRCRRLYQWEHTHWLATENIDKIQKLLDSIYM